MNTLGVADIFNSHSAPSHFAPFLMHLPPELAVFYCSGDYARRFPGYIDDFKGRGLKVTVDDYSGLAGHEYLLFDDSSSLVCLLEGSRENPPENGLFRFWQRYARPGARRIVYSHSVDDGPGEHSLPPGSFALHPYERGMYNDTGEGLFMQDESGKIVVTRSAAENERTVAGFTHFAGYEIPRTAAARQLLKDELARRMGVQFNPALPLVVFTYAPMDADEAEAGILGLAEKANVVVKIFPGHAYLGAFDRAPEVSGPNIFMTVDHSLNALMRLAADVNLASFISSAFVSCVAHRLPTIAVCTQRMSSASPRGIFSYALYFSFLDKAYARLARSLGPINIAFTDKIMERLGDDEYWRRYDELLPGLLANVFGDYPVCDEAAALGAGRIADVLAHGSFVTPEMKRTCRVYKGKPEGGLGMPMDL